MTPVTDPTDTRPLRVLCVDDHPDSADSLAAVLDVMGFAVAVAHDAATALDVAAAFGPRAWVLDISMPGMDGCELAARLRAGPGGEELLLVALTALGDYDSLGRMADAGFDLHYAKPVAPGELRDALRDYSRSGRPGAAV